MTGAKVFAIERYSEKIPGCTIVKHTKKTNNKGEVVYCTYYESVYVTFERFLSRVKLDGTVIHVTQFDPDTGKTIDDPRLWNYQLLILSSEEFDWEFEGWKQVFPSREAKGVKNTWITQYASKDEPWEELMNCIKEDRELNKIVHHTVPNLGLETDLFRMVRNRRYFMDPRNKKRRNVSVIMGGGTRATKYEYPPDCISKEDRTRFRRKKRKEDGQKRSTS